MESMTSSTFDGSGDAINVAGSMTICKPTLEGEPTHILLYTDGGCLQDKRLGGWAVHGYIYKDEPAKQGTGCKKAIPTKDGYVLGSGKPEITPTHYVDAFGSINKDATNNVAELRAAVEALQIVLSTGLKHAYLLLDSKYVLQGIGEWLPKWIENKWLSSQGQPVANRPLWEDIKQLLDRAKSEGVEIRLKWVKGHAGEFGNEIVDNLATLSLRAAVFGRYVYEKKIVESKGYWKSVKTHSRLLNLPTWYYGVREDARDVTDVSLFTDGQSRTIYYQGNLTEAVEYNGKMISDASFSVVYLKEPDPTLEIIRMESYKLAKASFYGLAVGYLPTIFKPDIYDLVETYGTTFLNYDLAKNRLLTSDKDKLVLVEELRPVRRAYYAVDRLQQLETILNAYLSQNPGQGFVYTEITDLLYEVSAGKKSTSVKLRPNITQSSRTLTCEVDCKPTGQDATKAKVNLLLAQDLPDRNTLSALAQEGIKVVVVTWADSSSVIRFATILQTADDVGIWSGVYSNLLILP